MTIVFEASALSSSRHLEGMDLEPQLSALAARWNHLESHFKLLRHMKTHTFLTQYCWCSPYLSFSCYKLNQRNLSFLYYSCSSGIQLLKCHVLSFGFHMCVTRQRESQKSQYYKNLSITIRPPGFRWYTYIFSIASVADATEFQPNRIMSVSWNSVCRI